MRLRSLLPRVTLINSKCQPSPCQNIRLVQIQHCSRGWRVVCLYVDTISLFEPSTQISPPINCFGWSWILDMDIAAKKCKMHFICQKKTTLPNSKNSRFTFKPLGSAEAEVTNTGCLLISRGWGSVKQSPGGVCRESLHLLLL